MTKTRTRPIAKSRGAEGIIAAHAKVHSTTVRRFLNGEHVRRSSAKVILDAMRELGLALPEGGEDGDE